MQQTINELANPLALENVIEIDPRVLRTIKLEDGNWKKLYGFTNEEIVINKQIRLKNRIKREITNHLKLEDNSSSSISRSLAYEYDLIQAKQSKLSARCREFIINHFKNN